MGFVVKVDQKKRAAKRSYRENDKAAAKKSTMEFSGTILAGMSAGAAVSGDFALAASAATIAVVCWFLCKDAMTDLRRIRTEIYSLENEDME